MTNNLKDIREFLDSITDNYDILEEGIDLQIRKEYIAYTHSFDHGELSEKETLNLASTLFNPNLSINAKKEVLTLLAHLGTITAFRQIEKYYKNPDKDLKQWTALALQECKMFLESTLTGQSIGFISSGLGGYQDKLRYYFLIFPSSDKLFTTTQKHIIKEKLDFVAIDLNCIVESVNPSCDFFGLTILVPIDVAVGIFIENGIKKCNALGDFVLRNQSRNSQRNGN